MRRVLLVSYYFPPSGGPGVQRALKFARYLPASGWAPTVLTLRPEAAAYPDLDPSLLDDIPPDVSVERTGAFDPYVLYAHLLGKPKHEAVSVGFLGADAVDPRERIARWIRANVFLPDARVGWVPFAVLRARHLIHTSRRTGRPIEAVWTTGPPHSTHLVGLALRRMMRVPWVADFRDPWTDISYYRDLPLTPLARRVDAALERRVVRTADAVVSVSEGFGRLLKAKATPRRYRTIPNGFDAGDVAGAAGGDRHAHRSPDAFLVTHVGTFTAAQHAPGFVAALARRVADPAWAGLRLRFVGHVDERVLADLRGAGLADRIERIPYVPHAEAVAFMRAADVLIVATQALPEAAGVVPGKVFECVGVGVPVLGLADPKGDLASVLERTGGGAAFGHGDADGIGRFLDRHRARVEARMPFDAPAPEVLRPFDRRMLTRDLAELLADVAGPPATRPPDAS